MLSTWINRAALCLVAMAALLFAFSLFAYINIPFEVEAPCHIQKPSLDHVLPSYFLPLTEKDYEAIGPPLFQSHWNPITLQLPDLRNLLFYYGINSRPDAKPGAIRLQFGVGPGGGSASTAGTLTSIAPGEPLYLVYERNQGAGRYLFSPNNEKTPLWVTAQPQENSAKIEVFLQDEAGRRILEPAIRAQFTLQQKELTRSGPTNWSLGPYRVDGTLLARQKARWYGQDLFLNDRGGTEYAEREGKERIEFGESPDRYIVYVGPDSCLIWKDSRWQPSSSAPDSTLYPLLCVKKIEERLLRFELWDVDGKARMPLTLLRSTENWNPTLLQRDFVFTAARTLSQYMFLIRKERATLRVHDWFLLTKEGWKKLVTPQQIDAYVEEKDPGILFVFEGVKEKGEVRVLSGMLYNATRSAKVEVEYPFDHNAKSTGGKSDQSKKRSSTSAHSPSAAQAQTQAVQKDITPTQTEGVNRSTSHGMRPFPEEDDDDDEGDDFDELDEFWMEHQK